MSTSAVVTNVVVNVENVEEGRKCLSYGDVICATSYLCSLDCLCCGAIICDISTICLIVYTIVGTANGSTLPLIILCSLTSMFSYSLFTLKLEVPPSSTLFFLLRALLEKFVVAFFFSGVVYISSVFLTVVNGFYGFSF